MPFCVTPGPTAVLSIMPLGLFREERSLPVSREYALVPPLFGFGGYDSRETLEGVLINTPFQAKTGSVESFAITHRTGRCDVAWNVGVKWTDAAGTEHLVVDHTAFEQGLKDCAYSAQLKLQFLGVDGPWVAICSAIGMMDGILMLGGRHPTKNAYRDQVLLKQTIIERIDDSALITFAESFYLLFGERRPNGKALAAR